MSEESQEPPAAADVAEVLRRIDARWRQLLQALEGIPEARLEEAGVVGEWSLKNLFGHLAFWDEHAIAEIDRALAGQPREDSEWQQMNVRDHAARLGRSLSEERSAMVRAHAALLDRLRALTDASAGKIDVAIRPDTYAHYEEHTPDVLAWRQREGV